MNHSGGMMRRGSNRSDMSDALFDQLVADAARFATAPVAVLGYLEGSQERVEASAGWNVVRLPGPFSLAARMQGEKDLVVVPDMAADRRFADHPLVSGPPFVKFLAAVPLLDDAGAFLGALTILDRAPRALSREQGDVLRLVAARILAERRVRRLASAAEEAQERFRDFFERTTDLIMSIDADGRLLHANQAVLEILGLRREELINQPLTKIVEPAARDDFRVAFGEVIAAGEPK